MKKNKKILTENEKQIRKKTIKKYTIVSFIHLIVVAFLLMFGLLWQNSFSFLAWVNTLWFTFVLVFFIGWLMIIYNNNIISSFVYSIKVFGNMLIGKKVEKSYYEYKIEVEDNQIPKGYLYISFITSLIVLIPAIITLIIFMNNYVSPY